MIGCLLVVMFYGWPLLVRREPYVWPASNFTNVVVVSQLVANLRIVRIFLMGV